MSKLTVEQKIVITGYTGVLCCKWDDFRKDLERRTGNSISPDMLSAELQPGEHLTKRLYEDDFFHMIEPIPGDERETHDEDDVGPPLFDEGFDDDGD